MAERCHRPPDDDEASGAIACPILGAHDAMLTDPLMTVREVAEKLKVKESTVRSYIRDKQLRAIKLGKDWRISVEDLDAFVEEHANK